MTPEILVAPVALLGSLATYRLNHDLRLGAVRASAGATLAFCLAVRASGYAEAPVLQAAFFGATFVGMAESERFTTRQVAAGALIYSLLYLLILRAPAPVKETGGLLGTGAFLSGVVVAGAELLWLKLTERPDRAEKA